MSPRYSRKKSFRFRNRDSESEACVMNAFQKILQLQPDGARDEITREEKNFFRPRRS